MVLRCDHFDAKDLFSSRLIITTHSDGKEYDDEVDLGVRKAKDTKEQVLETRLLKPIRQTEDSESYESRLP